VKVACVDARRLVPMAMPTTVLNAFRTLPGFSAPQ